MQLVVTEKPSVAQAIARVIGADKRKDGYMEGSGYLVSWCIGHLVELAQPEAYSDAWEKWSYDSLPIIPEEWRTEVKVSTAAQYNILKGLMHDVRVDSIVCATDAGREGELIFRLVYEQAGCQKNVERLWISSMEDFAIREGFARLKPASDYDRLYAAALCRAKADWLVGINATRLFSLLYHRTLNIGRVMTPTLALIVQREADISAFHPRPFYTVSLALDGFTVTGNRMEDKAQAEALRDACLTAGKATVKSVERREKTEKPPALYDLTTLQREANRLLDFTAQQTLDYLQSLYEKKLATYPRTDSRYLTSDMAGSLPVLVNLAAKSMPCAAGAVIRCNAAQVINDGKVSDHHAIIPTETIRDARLSELPAGELALLQLITVRLLCAVGQPYAYAETAVTVECAGEEFTAKIRTVLTPGWRELDGRYKATLKNRPDPDKDKEAKALPLVFVGDTPGVVTAAVKEGKTSPPAHFTEDSLLAAMETAGAGEIPEDAERKGLGTPATRAGIIEKLIRVGFLERRKEKVSVRLMPTQAGTDLIAILPEIIKSPKLTTAWENKLSSIEKGECSEQGFLEGIEDMVKELIRSNHSANDEGKFTKPVQEIFGKCPKCGGDVVKGKYGAYCKNKCGMVVSRAMGITLNDSQIKNLLAGNKTFVKGIKGKSGPFNAFLIPDGIADYSYINAKGTEVTGTRYKIRLEFT